MPKTTSANVNSKQDDETGDQYCKTFLSLIQTFPRAAAADRCSAKNYNFFYFLLQLNCLLQPHTQNAARLKEPLPIVKVEWEHLLTNRP